MSNESCRIVEGGLSCHLGLVKVQGAGCETWRPSHQNVGLLGQQQLVPCAAANVFRPLGIKISLQVGRQERELLRRFSVKEYGHSL